MTEIELEEVSQDVAKKEGLALTQLAKYVHEKALVYLVSNHVSPRTLNYGKIVLQNVCRAAAMLVGGFSAYYYFRPAQDTGKDMAEWLGATSGSAWDTSLQNLSAISCSTVNALLAAQCLMTALADLFSERDSEAHRFLCPEPSKPKRALKYSALLMGVMGFIAPGLALSIQQNITMAILSTFANVPVGIVGVNSLLGPLLKPSHPPYRQIFLEYLHEQIGHLGKAYEDNPEMALSFIEGIKKDYSDSTSTSSGSSQSTDTHVHKLRGLIEKLLNGIPLESHTMKADDPLGEEEVHVKNHVEKNKQRVPVIKATADSRGRRFFKPFTIGVSIASIGGYVWSAGQTVSRVNEKIASGYKIGGGVLLAFLSLLPQLGMSYKAGKEVGGHLWADNPKIAANVNSRISLLLKVIVGFLSACSGGSNFNVNKNLIKEFPALGGFLTEHGQHYLANAYGSVGLVGAPIVNYYYSAELVNEVIVFFAKTFDKQILSCVRSAQFFQALYQVFSDMRQNHFDNILRALLSKDDSLSKTLFAVFKERLGGYQYQDMLEKFQLEDPPLSLDRRSRAQSEPSGCCVRRRQSYCYSPA